METLKRIVSMFVRPREEWLAIEREQTTIDRLVRRYIVPLSLVPPIATVIGMQTFDASWDPQHGYVVPRDQIYAAGAATLIATIGSIFVLAAIFRLLAPMYGSRRDYLSALKVATYGAVPVLVASATLVLPVMVIVSVVALTYTLFLYWLGVRDVLQVPANQQTEFVGISMMLLGALSALLGAAASSLGLF